MPAAGSLHCLIYRSRATGPLDAEALVALLRKARLHNQQTRLGGLLLYCQQQFLQVLEGSESELSRLYSRIQVDSRHESVATLAFGPIATRAFPDWRMGFAAPAGALLERVTGFLQLSAAPGLAVHPPEELRQLLRDFAQGRAYDY